MTGSASQLIAYRGLSRVDDGELNGIEHFPSHPAHDTPRRPDPILDFSDRV